MRARLDQGNAVYERAVADARRKLLAAMDARVDAATVDGDWTLVRSLRAARAGAADGTPPTAETTEPAVFAAEHVHDQAAASAAEVLVPTYRLAVRAHTRGGRLEAARAAQAELDGLGLCMPSDAKSFGGHWYAAYGAAMTWDAAQRKCPRMGGHLAYVESQAEHEFVWKLCGRSNCWLGATRGGDGEWQWANGGKVTFTWWAAGQPDDSRGIQNAMYIWTGDGHWDDFEGTAAYPFVCEWDGPPR